MSKNSSQQGFTLIEMIVAIALFIVVATVAMGALLKIVDLNKKSQGMKSVITNMNFALESMTRELRVGTDYTCVTGSQFSATSISGSTACSETDGVSSWSIAFVSSKRPSSGNCNLIYAYYFDYANSTLSKGEQTGCNGTLDWYPIVYGGASDPAKTNDALVKFELGSIEVIAVNERQAFVKLHFKGTVGSKEKLKSDFDLQAGVSQRLGEI
jgi:prepilin-type N-terminal cleavage/methylation domain-containing protein